MTNKAECVAASYRDEFHHVSRKNSDGMPMRVRVNGKCKTWKTRPNDFQLPVKYGLYESGYITQDNAHEWISGDGREYKRNPSEVHVDIGSHNVKRNPIKRPGKFEGETYAAKYVYETSDGGIGSVDELGWYDYYSGKIKGRGPFHIIVSENSQGFVTGTFYDTKAQMEKAWARIEKAYEEYDVENGDGD